MQTNQFTHSLLIFIILALSLSACDGNLRDLQSYTAKLKQPHPTTNKNETSPIPKPPIPISYQASGLRTPFELTEAMAGDKSSDMHPLQAYSLAMLRFVGTVSEDDTTSAYILTPDNKVYPVKNGDIIGNHHGNIISIHPDHIEVMEKDIDDAKRPVQRLVTLQLKD